MQINFTDVLITVFSLVILAVPGFIFAKCKMLPQSASETISVIVLYGCQSFLVLTSFQNSVFNPSIAVNMLIVFGLAVALHLLMFGLIMLVTVKREPSARLKCVRYASLFSNCGFMGFPFLQSIFGELPSFGEIMIYAAVVVAVFNIMNWTLGVYIMTGSRKEISVKKILLNPVIISVVIGFLLFVLVGKPVADVAEEGSVLDKILTKFMGAMNFFSDMVTPLSMTVIGIKLANINFKRLFIDKSAYFTGAMKLLIMPLLTALAVAFLPVAEEIKYVTFFLLAMPTATSTVLFAVRFGGDGDAASISVLLSTILSVATIPLMYLLFGVMLG